jgi:transposase
VLTLPASVRIYLAVEPVDLRRGHDGLSAVVQGQWRMDLFAGHLFVCGCRAIVNGQIGAS